MGEPAADRHPGQDGGQREDGQRQQAADPEQRERGQAANGGVGVEPRVVSMWNWTAAPAALPPGRLLVTALPASPAVTTANQPLVRSACRCRAKLQMNETSSAARQAVIQAGFSVDSRGQAPSTAMSLGRTRYRAAPATSRPAWRPSWSRSSAT